MPTYKFIEIPTDPKWFENIPDTRWRNRTKLWDQWELLYETMMEECTLRQLQVIYLYLNRTQRQATIGVLLGITRQAVNKHMKAVKVKMRKRLVK